MEKYSGMSATQRPDTPALNEANSPISEKKEKYDIILDAEL
jgi:hypothetical protein